MIDLADPVSTTLHSFNHDVGQEDVFKICMIGAGQVTISPSTKAIQTITEGDTLAILVDAFTPVITADA